MRTFDKCLVRDTAAAAVNRDLADGKLYGVAGTPSLFVNKQPLTASSELEARVREALTTPRSNVD